MRSNQKTPARQHAEWLSLVEVSGPFLTLSVLLQHLQLGLEAHDAELYRSVQEAYQDWEESHSPQIHNAWVRFLLTAVLDYPPECIGEAQQIPESSVADLQLQGQRIRPDLVILDPEDLAKVKMPILVYPRSQKLDSPVSGSSWAASPHSRMQILLQNTGVQAGFVTNGAQWSLVHVRKGEPTGFATWQTMLLTEEKLLLQAFKGILGVERTFGAPAGETMFDLLDKSAQDQEEVTKELGRQVRQAVEVFINALDRLDQDSGRALLQDFTPQTIYNGALTVMMRLIFLLCAEERDLMDNRALYIQHYSVGALNDQLREIAGGGDEQLLEHRHDAWNRLLATFRLVHGGCDHQDLNLPAYGGSLFDPAKYPFLERAQIDNRVTLHLLDALEFLQVRVPGGRERRRLSFRALGVEQIGHVYEGLLDHTAVRAQLPIVGLTGKETEEQEIPLTLLEENRQDLQTYFDKNKIKASGNVQKLLHLPHDILRASKLRQACGPDDTLYHRLLPFLNLIREDSLEHVQIYPTGALYVTTGADRRSSGTHYTPVTLTEELVRYALEPQVYLGPAQGTPPQEWKLKTAKQLVDLKVCDIAMGSGAFLVQTCRYLAERLVESWAAAKELAQRPLGFSNEGNFFTRRIETDHRSKVPGQLAETPFGNLAIADPSAELISDNPEERLAQARRIIADCCLYGVDINPMAVEMAKLSLWLTTMRRDRPFTFLDHALKVGDSLLGVSESQLQSMTMRPEKETASLLFHWVPDRLKEVRNIRHQISKIPSHDADSVRKKSQLTLMARMKSNWLQEAADLLLLSELRRLGKSPFSQTEWDGFINILKEGPYKLPDEVAELKTARSNLNRPTFNWELAFPEIFESGGFHAIVGNPPFLGGQKITGAFGTDYRDYMVSHLAHGTKGSADLCAYFFLQSHRLLKPGGSLALLATNTIAQGDTREVGLDQILAAGGVIFRAAKSDKWPGVANLEIAKVWISKTQWDGPKLLEGIPVNQITALLDDGTASGKPHRLLANEGLSYIGSYVLGMGFVLTPEEARTLIHRNNANKTVLLPYLNGEDLNSRPDQSPSRWVINFFDWPLGRVNQRLPHCGESVLDVIRAGNHKISDDWLPKPGSRWADADQKRQAKWLQLGVVPADYPHPVAADFPDCLQIVERLVRPERQRSGNIPDKQGRNFQLRYPLAERWWIYGEKRPELYRTLKPLPRCLACSIVSQHFAISWYAAPIVFSHRLAVFPFKDNAAFAAIQSNIHQAWARAYSSTLETRLNYSPSDCFETFPLPPLTRDMDTTGAALNAARTQATTDRQIGLTNLAHLINDPAQQDPDLNQIRQAIIAMDEAVSDAYGWQNLELAHGFYGEGRDRRFTISPAARQQVLLRLLKLNHQRYDQEVEKGPHQKAIKLQLPHPEEESLSSPPRHLFDAQMSLGDS